MTDRLIKRMSIILSVLFMLGILGACGTKEGKKESESGENLKPITYTALDYNGEKEWGKDEISQEITKRTGITLQYIPIGSNGDEKCNILLASGDIPDIILQNLWGSIEKKYVAARAVLQLDELVEKHGPNIKEAYGDALDLLRSEHKGKLYTLSCWYQKPFVGFPNNALLMRKDILKEFEPQKVEGEGYFTFEEYLELLRKVKAKYPDMIGYLPNGESLGGWVLWSMRGFLGINNYSIQGDQLKLYYQDPKFFEAYKLLNTIFREGLADPEWPVLKNDPFMEKCASGKVFSSTGSYWDLGDANNVLEKEDKEKIFLPYKLVGPDTDPQKLPLGGTPGLGWDSVMIGKNCKEPERLVKFLDFCASQEGHRLMYFGIEGKHYDLVNDSPVPKDFIVKAMRDGNYWDTIYQTVGLQKWSWAIIDTRGNDTGDPFDPWAYLSRKDGKAPIDVAAFKTLGDTAYDETIFKGIEPDAGTPEALISQKCEDIFIQASPRIINAASEAECISLFEKMQKDLELAGVEKVNKILTENFKRRRDVFDWK